LLKFLISVKGSEFWPHDSDLIRDVKQSESRI